MVPQQFHKFNKDRILLWYFTPTAPSQLFFSSFQTNFGQTLKNSTNNDVVTPSRQPSNKRPENQCCRQVHTSRVRVPVWPFQSESAVVRVPVVLILTLDFIFIFFCRDQDKINLKAWANGSFTAANLKRDKSALWYSNQCLSSGLNVRSDNISHIINTRKGSWVVCLTDVQRYGEQRLQPY